MRGQVLGVDRDGREGRITGEDGQRYWFQPDDWSDRTGPAIGAQVDFEVSNGRALRIYHVPGTVALAPKAQLVPNDRNRLVAALLACPFLIGMLGVHRFYTGRIGSGIVTLLLTCTVVGMVITFPWAFIDMIRYLTMSDEEFAIRYPRR